MDSNGTWLNPRSLVPIGLRRLLDSSSTPLETSKSIMERINKTVTFEPFKECEVTISDPERQFVDRYFEHFMPTGYRIKRITYIHNPALTWLFEHQLKEIESASFPLSATNAEVSQDLKQLVLKRWQFQSRGFSPFEHKGLQQTTQRFENVKLLPLWQGCSAAVCRVICQNGFNLTSAPLQPKNAQRSANEESDQGIYFTTSSRKAIAQSQGHLLLSWVALHAPISIGNEKNAHKEFSVYRTMTTQDPVNPSCSNYSVCKVGQQPICDDIVVFKKSQALPRFWIELEVESPELLLRDSENTAENLFFLVLSLVNDEEVKKNERLFSFLKTLSEHLTHKLGQNLLPRYYQKLFKYLRALYSNQKTIIPAVVDAMLKEFDSFATKEDISPPSPVQLIRAEKGNVSEQYILGHIYCQGLGVEVNYSEALKWYQRAAQQGSAEAQFSIGTLYSTGQGVEANLVKATQWYIQAAERDPAHQFFLGNWFANADNIGIYNEKEATKWYLKAADAGKCYAQYVVGIRYEQGLGAPKDLRSAFKWFRKAAKQGHVAAQHRVALAYEQGAGVHKNTKHSHKWRKISAERGYAVAQFELGCFYEGGLLGLKKNVDRAFFWYLKAALQQLPMAQFRLGYHYLTVKEDFTKAAKWILEAANQGYAFAQYEMAISYERGRGVKENPTEAFRWAKEAAMQNDPHAQHFVATYYLLGEGVNKDENLALEWMKKSADQGHVRAGYDLGCMCEEGIGGIEKDLGVAILWYRRAAQQGNEDAKEALERLNH